jgi:uncharacterized protein (DUF885 family)
MDMSVEENIRVNATMNANDMFQKLSEEMLDKFLENNPDFATFLGLHDPFDHLLPEGSTKRFVTNLQWMENFIRRLHETIQRNELSEEHRIDWDMLERAYVLSKFSFHKQRMHELNPDVSDEIGGLIFIMFTRDYAPFEERVDAIAARIEKMPQFFKEFRSRFDDSQPVKVWTELAIEKTQNIGGLFQLILHATKGKVSSEVYERVNKAVENIQPALQEQMEWLHNLLPKAKEEWALGRETFEELLQLRELGLTSEEIHSLGAWYLNELKTKREELAQRLAPDKSVEEVLKMIENNAPKTFEEALVCTRKTIEKAKQFVQKKNIVTVSPEDRLLVEETPAFLTPIIPFAALIPPAKFDKPQVGIYLVTKPKDLGDLGKHLNYPSIKITAAHEAFPGHFLQITISNQTSFIRFLEPGMETIEGWAHYCEEMMVEAGFLTELETRFIQINDMIWRAVRIIVDVQLARGEMTREAAITTLVEETGMSRDAAKAEVNWYTQSPGYALSYLLGKHLLLKLKEEVKQKLGKKFDQKIFHDTVTINGCVPISMLRKIFK